jgi:hypothetical protein
LLLLARRRAHAVRENREVYAPRQNGDAQSSLISDIGENHAVETAMRRGLASASVSRAL